MFDDPNMNLYQMCAKIRSRQLDAADHVRRACECCPGIHGGQTHNACLIPAIIFQRKIPTKFYFDLN